uniref:Uncharacterized protein n=1 Tax=Arundo donax TaxID=35708 RepID=A0A0A8YX99_ARUDO
MLSWIYNCVSTFICITETFASGEAKIFGMRARKSSVQLKS